MKIVAKKRSRLFEELILKSWWTILFFLLCYFVYDQGMRRRHAEEDALIKKASDFVVEKERALKHQEDLKLQLMSQDDSAWIEMVLMKNLGLVPEGQRKVCFKEVTPSKQQ
jgi:hypothetical protein